MMLGLLLARAGAEMTVLEKHGDFLRDFRGDTVHPSTLRLLDELGLGEEFARLPFARIREMRAQIGTTTVVLGDLRHLGGFGIRPEHAPGFARVSPGARSRRG